MLAGAVGQEPAAPDVGSVGLSRSVIDSVGPVSSPRARRISSPISAPSPVPLQLTFGARPFRRGFPGARHRTPPASVSCRQLARCLPSLRTRRSSSVITCSPSFRTRTPLRPRPVFSSGIPATAAFGSWGACTGPRSRPGRTLKPDDDRLCPSSGRRCRSHRPHPCGPHRRSAATASRPRRLITASVSSGRLKKPRMTWGPDARRALRLARGHLFVQASRSTIRASVSGTGTR